MFPSTIYNRTLEIYNFMLQISLMRTIKLPNSEKCMRDDLDSGSYHGSFSSWNKLLMKEIKSNRCSKSSLYSIENQTYMDYKKLTWLCSRRDSVFGWTPNEPAIAHYWWNSLWSSKICHSVKCHDRRPHYATHTRYFGSTNGRKGRDSKLMKERRIFMLWRSGGKCVIWNLAASWQWFSMVGFVLLGRKQQKEIHMQVEVSLSILGHFHLFLFWPWIWEQVQED